MLRMKWALLIVTAILLCNVPQTRAGTVHVTFARETTEIKTLNASDPFFNNHKEPATGIPDELNGLSFTHRRNGISCDVEIKAEGDTTVYAIVEAEDGKHRPTAVLDALANSGWKRVDAPDFATLHRKLAAFKRSLHSGETVKLSHGPSSGFCIAAKDLEVDSQTSTGDSKPGPPAEDDSKNPFHPDPPLTLKRIYGPTTNVSQLQTSIKALVVLHISSGVSVGRTMHTVLTVMRGNSATEVNFRFISPVGPQMRSCRNDALRYVHVRFPNWSASGADLTFENRDEGAEGGSIGAVLSTLMLSAIEGFTIDHNVAVTGDVSADGSLLKIGGVFAKVHGAEDSNCTLVVIPTDNFGELINTKDYIAKGAVPKLQVVGAETVDDVIAAVRTDRSVKFAKAMELYDEVTQGIQGSKTYLRSTECTEKLNQILTLVPLHLSAKLLLMEATNKRPKTLSAGASQYYLYAAVEQIMPLLVERSKEGGQLPPSTVVHDGLQNLEELRTICDSNMVPVIDAWERYIRTLSSYQSGLASPRNLEVERQAVIDAMAKVDMNADLMQKMMKEGI
jgi:hypothetical protein